VEAKPDSRVDDLLLYVIDVLEMLCGREKAASILARDRGRVRNGLSRAEEAFELRLARAGSSTPSRLRSAFMSVPSTWRIAR
jgi:hypothetical protein